MTLSDIQPRVLIVEDNPLIVEFVQEHLQRQHFHVDCADGIEEARRYLSEQHPDLIVLDVVLDDGLGFDLCRAIRTGDDGNLSQVVDVPILMLTARAEEQDRLEGFRAGADDYLTKPFNPDELLFRIQAIIRRTQGISNTLIAAGPLRVDPRSREVFINGDPVELTLKEFELLHLLASNVGRAFSREELCERVWGYSFVGNSRTVDVHVNRLRQKLSAGAEECSEMICTEWGVGYKFVPLLALSAGA